MVFNKIKKLIPINIRRMLLGVYQSYMFTDAINKFRRLPIEELKDKSILSKLIFGWGNQGWSANTGYLESCINIALKSNMDILECGSGLTTIVVGLIAKRKGLKVISLEHNQSWVKKVNKYLKKLDLSNVHVYVVPIRSFFDYHWYDIAGIELPKTFTMVICDGPPAQTQGGRYGLVPIMNKYFTSGTKILMDDTHRKEEREIIRKWTSLIDLDENKISSNDSHSILCVK